MPGVLKQLIIVTALATVLVSAYAFADRYVNPWAGVQFGSDVQNGRGGFGVSAGAMGGGVIGSEVGFGFSPSFFGTKNDCTAVCFTFC